MKKKEVRKPAVTIDLKLEDLPRESLIGLVRLYSRLMMDIDGFWYLSMKDRAGNEEAIACDNWVWGKVVKKMLNDLADLIEVEGRDVVDFMTVIQATPLHHVVEEKMEARSRNRATLTVTHCPTLAALEKEDAGRDTVHCRLACSVTRARHAELFNPAIEVRCLTMPPRKHKQGIFCRWEYKMGKSVPPRSKSASDATEMVPDSPAKRGKRKNRAPPLLTKREPCAYHSHSVLVSTLKQARHNKNKRRERDGPSLLCEVQEEGGDQGREAGHPQEQEARGQWLLPVLWDQGLQDRQALAPSVLPCPAQHTWRRNVVWFLCYVDVVYCPAVLNLLGIKS